MGAGITYCCGKQLGYNAVIMCPPHLVHKWEREITESVPNAVCHIVSKIEEVAALKDEINNTSKTYNLYLIISYGSAKFKYNTMPCAKYSLTKRAYICPSCGQVLTKKVKDGKYTCYAPMSHEDFKKENKINVTCHNYVQIYDSKANTKKTVLCGEKLWRPVLPKEKATDWIKLGKHGWFHISHLQELHDQYEYKIRSLSPSENDLYHAMQKTLESIENGEEIQLQGLTKFPLAEYIKRTFKNKIECTVFDEVHELSGDSLQGKAMCDLAKASKNVVGLTGTLINGYADFLFEMLYRLIPRTMQAKGYKYNDSNKFLRDYGSTEIVKDRSYMKRLAGVSPSLFTDFLIDLCSFITLDDVAVGLPDYTEIPVPLELDNDVSLGYQEMQTAFRHIAGFRGEYPKTTSSFVRAMVTYPDMPYDQAPIVDPESNQVAYQSQNVTNFIDNKLEKVLELVTEKVNNGEKVLIYYTWTNITNVKDILKEALEQSGYQVAVLESGSSIKSSDREAWVKKQVEKGIDVLLCNPKLVETGLDLLDFTTIIWYQLNDNVSTMRQASRRSWRLGQQHDIEVYFLYYEDTVQEDMLSLMATKLQAAMTTEGRSNQEGLSAMSRNQDLTTQITNNVMKGISEKVNFSSFNTSKKVQNGEEIKIDVNYRIRKTRNELKYRKPIVAKWYRFKKTEPKVSQSDKAIFDLLDYDLLNLLV